jgi:uncharacterized membrane protein YgdD (TMEM256/DUF423 family)
MKDIRKNSHHDLSKALKYELIENPEFAKGRRFALAYTITWLLIALLVQTIGLLGEVMLFVEAESTQDIQRYMTFQIFQYIAIVALIVCLAQMTFSHRNTKFTGQAMIFTGVAYLITVSTRPTLGFTAPLFLLFIMFGYLMLRQRSIMNYRTRVDQILQKHRTG